MSQEPSEQIALPLPGPHPEVEEPEAAPPRTLAQRAREAFAGLWRTRLDKSTWRIRLAAAGFACLFAVIGGKLVWLGFKPDPQTLRRAASEAVSRPRPDIVDRNGVVLATDVKVMSVFAEPRRIVSDAASTSNSAPSSARGGRSASAPRGTVIAAR